MGVEASPRGKGEDHMKIVPTVEPSDMGTAYLPAIWVRIAFSRAEVIFRQCHFFTASEYGGVDLFRNGNNSGMSLERFASFNKVMLIEQVDGPHNQKQCRSYRQPKMLRLQRSRSQTTTYHFEFPAGDARRRPGAHFGVEDLVTPTCRLSR